MLLGIVIGTMNATLKHERFKGQRILLVQPLTFADPQEAQPSARSEKTVRIGDLIETGDPFLAVDTVQAGPDTVVLATREGGSARLAMGDDHAPVHAAILGIVDTLMAETRP